MNNTCRVTRTKIFRHPGGAFDTGPISSFDRSPQPEIREPPTMSRLKLLLDGPGGFIQAEL